MKSRIKKFFAVLLALSLISGSMVCFASDSEKKYYDYGTYVLLGDSVASGYNDIEKIDSEFTRVENSYGAIVADALGAELIPMACPGFRTIEIRYMLEDDYAGDDYLFHDANDAEVMKARIPQYREAISEADLITLGVGGNDFGTYLTWIIADIMVKEGVTIEFAEAVKDLLEDTDVSEDKLDLLVDLAAAMDSLPELIEALPQALIYGLSNFMKNWNYMIEDIYALNPDVTLLVIGMFDTGVKTEEDAAAKETDTVKFNIGQAIVDMANTPMIQGAEKYGYTFVDTTGTTCDTYHPNAAGHMHIAEKILEALPDANFPYTDVKLGTPDYKTVEYVYKNGIMDGTSETTFSPDDALTKAQLASALYNIAGAPDVSSITASFSDVDDNNPARNAIIWVNDKGFLTADSNGNFAPDDKISVINFAATLLRAARSENNGILRFVKAFILFFNILKDNGITNFGSAITRINAAAKLIDYSKL